MKEIPELEAAKELVRKERPKILFKKRYREDLSPEEELFCREYILHGNATQAIKATGYEGRNPSVIGSNWLKRPRIQKKLARLKTRDEAQADMTRDIYLAMLKDTYQRAMADGDYSGANRAMELIGKHLGYLVDQKAVFTATKKIENPEAMQAEVQRLARIAGVPLE
jgi:hypothetical protein